MRKSICTLNSVSLCRKCHCPALYQVAQWNRMSFQKSSVRSSLRRARAGTALSPPRAGMERLRRSFRESFRRRKGSPPESARPHQWHADEAAVRAGTCTFPVKYLGCVEVFESRGMQVCEEALKVLRVSSVRFTAVMAAALTWRSMHVAVISIFIIIGHSC